MPTRIFLISPYSLFLEGLRGLLQASPETFVVTGTGLSVAAADPALIGQADVLFVDLSDRADAAGVLAGAQEARACCQAPLVLMVDGDRLRMSAALIADVGASVVSRYISAEALLELIRGLPAGGVVAGAAGPGPVVDERRRHLRIPVHTPVRIGSVTGEIKDISATGMYIQTQYALDRGIGDAITLEVEFHGAEGPSILICEGSVVRKIVIGQMTGVAIAVSASYPPGG
jgi:DNA-binding NarL/FixJ family response regulator